MKRRKEISEIKNKPYKSTRNVSVTLGKETGQLFKTALKITSFMGHSQYLVIVCLVMISGQYPMAVVLWFTIWK